MHDKQRDIFNNERKAQAKPTPETLAPSSGSTPSRRGLFHFLTDTNNLLVRIGGIGFLLILLMEMFLPNAFQPSTFLANRLANLESKKLIGTQRAISDAEALKAFEVGNVQNSIAEQQAHLVNELTAQIERANQCETQKLQLGNQAMTECIMKEKGTFTACQATQMMISAQPCPKMPEMSEQTKELLAKYQALKKEGL